MKVEDTSKDKIIKLIALFMVLMLVFTITSRTIYINLSTIVDVISPTSGVVETKLILDCKVGLDNKILEKRTKKIKASMDGEIIECKLEEGQEVKQGEQLCVLYHNEDNEEAKYKEQISNKKLKIEEDDVNAQIVSVQREITDIEKKYASKEKEYNNIENISEVQIKDKEIVQQKELVKVNSQLVKEGVLAEAEYIESNNKLNALILERQSLVDQRQKSLKEQLDELLSNKVSMEDKLITLQNDLSRKRIENESDSITKKVEKKEIVAPINGCIKKINYEQGDTVNQGEILFEVQNQDVPYTISFEANNSQASKIVEGMSVKVNIDEIEEETKVAEKTQNEDGTYIVNCPVSNETLTQLGIKGAEYKMGTVQIVNKSSKFKMIIPTSSIISENGEKYIFTIEQQGESWNTLYTVNKVKVNILKEGDNTVAIEGKISANDQIVTSYSKELKDKDKVRIK